MAQKTNVQEAQTMDHFSFDSVLGSPLSPLLLACHQVFDFDFTYLRARIVHIIPSSEAKNDGMC